jgi:hypothetical protein
MPLNQGFLTSFSEHVNGFWVIKFTERTFKVRVATIGFACYD